MTTASILPDGSVVIAGPQQVIHVDASHRAINIRAPSSIREVGGVTIASFACDAAQRIRMCRQAEDRYQLFLDLTPDRVIDLGVSPTHTVAMRIAWAVSDVTKAEVCVETSDAPLAQGTVVPIEVAEVDDEPTTPIPVIEEMAEDEAVTELPGSARALRFAELARRIHQGEPATESDRALEDPEPTRLDPWAHFDGEAPTPADTYIDAARDLGDHATYDDFSADFTAAFARTPPPEIAEADGYIDDDDPMDDTACRPITDEERIAGLPEGDEPLMLNASDREYEAEYDPTRRLAWG